MNKLPFKRKLLATAVASCTAVPGAMLGMAAAGSAGAQQDPAMEEILVVGIRGSLQRSMDLKRSAQGVVDAITAEDIGKMPDTNLAESLQRVTGVSIDRNNGEGSRVTVRGFGPDYNVVTLNGRHMPAANLEATSASASRSFDFAQLASESVRGVEIYKSGRAHLPTGGIGSVINIQTTRPLEQGERILSFSSKALYDTTTREGGGHWTPEASGIYSETFADGTFGIAFSGIYAERDSGFSQGGTTSGWYTIPGGQGDWGSIAPDNENFGNAPQAGDIYSVPRNINYAFGQVQRKRTNGLLTLQWEPDESLTGTLDYTYSDFEVEERRNDFGAWFNGVPSSGLFTPGCGNGCVVAPIIYADATGADSTFGSGSWGIGNELNSIGVNLEWRVTDRFDLSFDYHDSEAEIGALDGRGTNNIVTGVQFNRAGNRVDYSSDLPVLRLDFSEPLHPSRMLTSGTSFRNSYMKHDIEQGQIHGELRFDERPLAIASIDFGLGYTDSTNRSAFSNAQRDTWGGYGAPADYSDTIFTLHKLSDEFDHLSGADSADLQPFYYRSDFDRMLNAIERIADANGETISPCGTRLCADPEFSTDRSVNESQTMYYAQVNFAWEDGPAPAHLAVGVRFEETEVESEALVPRYSHIQWSGDNEFNAIRSGVNAIDTDQGRYENLLPNIDFDIEVVPDVILRASRSVTITRPGFADLQGGKTIEPLLRFNGGTGGFGNTDLDPFESTNLDLSGEWYYDDSSYFSIGYYEKQVENFIGSNTVNESLFNLPHPAQGPRHQAAVEALGTTDAAVIRPYLEGLYGTPVIGSAEQGDPAAVFSLTFPVNARQAEIDGVEFALQHMLGDSGLGFILNYTTVDGDIGYDDFNTNKGEGVENQFALLGLSDSANAVLFYDRGGIQARLAYNWRDDFLAGTVDGGGERNPVYTSSYAQVDANVSYDVPQYEGLTLFAEGINITDETLRLYGRHTNMVILAIEQGARYSLGLRYQF